MKTQFDGYSDKELSDFDEAIRKARCACGQELGWGGVVVLGFGDGGATVTKAEPVCGQCAAAEDFKDL